MSEHISLPSHMLRAALVCVANDTSREVLTAVHITPDILEASNGHAAVRMTHEGVCDRDIVIVFKGKIPRAAVATYIKSSDVTVAEHYGKTGDLVGVTACQVINMAYPSEGITRNIPQETDTSTVAALDTRYLTYPDKMFGTGQGRKQVGAAVCPSCLGGAVRFRFDRETMKLFGDPVFIVMPIRYDGETGL
ncbi:TPA: hypothetical protein RMT71_003159 [Escherichia coli]|nr:hypothetical protein [Escherichia coli]